MTNINEMISVLEAFRNEKVIEWYDFNRGEWLQIKDPSWAFNSTKYRIKPDEPKKLKYLCYEDTTGYLVWRTAKLHANASWIRRPEFDKECLE